ncbi:redoxin domain-containing protein [Methanolobus zinderi]|uniref:Redoxin domain-containing protein n=1 Tax=Methanolobus zinderi TaxID=536044 RepID=A0A7D5I3C7_9EURY|nr:redoxin domain-containing protein [Methanolobus zinderi]QLC48861.1 redoxin domain-containing protein [Methanolobus zinderi]
MSELKTGETIVDFTLYDTKRNEVRLHYLKGKNILLAFHPLAWTKGCARHMKMLEDNYEKLSSMNTVAFGISIDSVPSKKAWAKELGVEKTVFLSDFWPHGEVARMYGMFYEDMGVSKRASILIDEDLKVKFVKVYEDHKLPDINEIFDAIEV